MLARAGYGVVKAQSHGVPVALGDSDLMFWPLRESSVSGGREGTPHTVRGRQFPAFPPVTGMLITTLLLVTIIAVAYELLKAFVLLHATWWQSAAVTMAFFGLSATVAVYRAVRAHAGLLARAHTPAAPHQHPHAEQACLAAAIAQAADSIVITDTQGTIQYVNPAFTRMTGYRADEVIGQNPRFLKSTKQPPTFYQNLWHTILAGQIWHGELINRRNDGACYIEEMRITPVRDASGVITHFLAIKQDVTGRRAVEEARASAEEAIRQREERYRSLITNIPDVLWTADAEGRTVFVSPNSASVFGYTPEDICQTGVGFDRIHPDDMQRVRDAYAVLFARHTMFDVEYRIQRRDGAWIWLHDRAIASYERDGKCYTDGIVSDITQRKAAEQALQATEEKYRSLILNIPDVAWTVDAERRVAFMSPIIERLLGYAADEPYRRGGLV